MKILKIRFENIHSLKGEHEIDFTKSPLVETGIFAIVGPTGAGKSTILDIIMLALYGQMPRINEKISKNTIDKYGAVLTRNTERAYAEIEFSSNNKTYRSKWVIKRTRNGTLSDYTMEISELPKGNIIESRKSDVPKVNERIIGLKYEQFLKSIVLAQGSFSKFLKAKPEERTEMLEKITGSEIYRTIGKRAFEMAQKHKKIFIDKENLLQNFSILTKEQKSEYVENQKTLTKNIKEYAEKITEITEKIKIKTNIKKINEQIQNLQEKKKQTDTEIENFNQYSDKLDIHEKLLNLKADLYEHKELENKNREFSESLTKTENKKANLEKTLNTKETEQQHITNDLEKTEEEYKINQIEIRNFNELSKKQDLNEQEYQIVNKNLEKTKTELNNLKKQKEKFTQKKEKLVIQLASTKKWIEKNIQLKELNSDFIIIEQALNNYTETKKSTYKTINESVFKNKFPKTKWNEYLNIANDISAKIKADINKLQTSNTSQNIEHLKTEYDNILSELPIIEKQSENVKKYAELISKKDGFLSKNKEFQINLTNLNEIENKTLNEIEITTILIEELRKRYEREQLEAKYEQDRLKLEDNIPCPLCGANHHPFVENKQEIKIDFTKQELKKSENKNKNLETDLKKLISDISKIKSLINSYKNQIIELEKEQKSVNKNFDKNNTIINQNFEINDNLYIAKYYKKILEQKTHVRERITDLETLAKLKNQYQTILNLSEKIDTVLNFYAKAKNVLNRYKSYYEGISKPDDILNKLKIQLSDFQENNEKIIELSNNINANIEIYNNNAEQITAIDKKVVELHQSTNNLKNILSSISNKKYIISTEKFAGQTGDEYEKTVRTKIDSLKNNLSDIKNKLTKISTQLSENKSLNIEFSIKLSEIKSVFEQKNSFLLNKLKNIGFTSVEQAMNGLLTEDEAKEIKQKNIALQETQFSINQSLDEIISAYNIELKNDDKKISLSELIKNNDILENKKQTTNQQIGSISTIIKNDDEQKEKLTSLKSEISILQTEYERWKALDNIIGDKKGKRFAEMAHKFTLRELIAISNKHLKNFSARYLLDKTSDSKNYLFVRDAYMGLTQRSVHTLSGGETFLVSLSMALALSDLASRKTKIESLFIDEGFGTLDEHTLNKALNSLEKMHTDYNRTIGLISHVPEIKERITTQISISKSNSGYSTIKIIP